MTNRPAKFKVRRGTTAEWRQFDDAGYILEDGQIGYDSDLRQLRIGDGVHKFAEIFPVGSAVGNLDTGGFERFRVLAEDGNVNYFYVRDDGYCYAYRMEGGETRATHETEAMFRNIIILPAGSDPETHSAATSAPEGTLIFVKD